MFVVILYRYVRKGPKLFDHKSFTLVSLEPLTFISVLPSKEKKNFQIGVIV